MPTTLPVPSKSALRALRSLAFGTSCTLALGAGLLTEDRRRRIHAAREVHDNAKKLKSSRKYHGTGTTILETLDDQSLQYREDAFWLPSNVLKSSIPNITTTKETKDVCESQDPSPSRPPVPKPFRTSRYELGHGRKVPTTKYMYGPPLEISPPNILENSISGPPEIPKIPKQKLHNRQGKLATDVTKLLQAPENIDEATSRFCEAFEEGLSIDGLGISPRLMEAAIQLANTCELQCRFENSEKVFDIIRNAGAIDEGHFHSFHPDAIISRLLDRYHSNSDTLDLESLRKACSIFLTKFKEKPRPLSKRLLFQGEKLCAKTCESGMYDLTLALYTRVQSGREGDTLGAVGPLIIATHMKGHHKKVFRYFHKYFLKTTPDQLQFFNVGNAAIESILKTGRIDRAEQALVAARETAEKNGLSMSTTWLLQVLGSDWRMHQNLEQSKAIFGRLEPCLGFVQHPQAFYGAMIQFCIEADDEPLARRYYDTLRELYPPVPGDVRIYGHFAFAKAKRNDWLGVKDDFLKMKSASPGSAYAQEIASSFTPILALYGQSHSISDTEDFVRFFVDEIGIGLTTNLMNIMVGIYGDAKEIDSLARWIDYATAAGCPVDSVTFNTILNKCSQSWDLPFWDIYRLYRSVCQLGSRHSRFVDEDTLPILRRLAMLNVPSQDELLRRLAVLKKTDRTCVDTFDNKTVLRSMAVTMAKQNPVATLKIYRCAQRDRIPLNSRHLHLAVKASLQLYPNDSEEPLRHIQDAQRMGIDVSGATAIIIIHQMTAMCEEGNKDGRPVTELLQRTVTALQDSGLTVSPTMVTQAMSVLHKRGHYRLCIDVWASLSRHLHIEPSSVDLVTLTVLLQAYIGLEDHLGIQWVVKTLSANKLYPGSRIRRYLRNARRTIIDLLKSGEYPDNMHSFLDALDEAIETTRLMQKEAVEDWKEVKFKTIQIMEKAIAEDEAAGRALGSSNFIEKHEVEAVRETSSNTSTIDVVEPLTDTVADEFYEMDLPSPQILLEVGAG
ncbi:hypothetical protein N431DRAFT_344304 [Stipitochalara longipes BDJ]|nr:hypothetical protein N431DRAFT_344304 [Stipitochalara longipes BDJ]